MKQNDLFDKMIRLLAAGGWQVDRNKKELLQAYIHLLSFWGKKVSLVSKADRENLVERHLVPSVLYATIIKKSSVNLSSVLDFGTGAGLPGVVLSILLGSTKMVLLDSNRKKCLFLQQVRKELGLDFSIVNKRIENWQEGKSAGFPVVVARAVAALPELIKAVSPFIKEGGFLLVMKGDNYVRELDGYKPKNHIAVSKEEISASWLRLTPYLKNKCFVKVEFVNARK